jgi:hypothetical protein
LFTFTTVYNAVATVALKVANFATTISRESVSIIARLPSADVSVPAG